MILLLIFTYSIFVNLGYIAASRIKQNEVCIVILTQSNDYHEKLYEKKELNILQQAESFQKFPVRVYKSYSLAEDDIGHWTIFPLITNLSLYTECEWVFFIEESTAINLEKMASVLQKYNSSKEVFAGYALLDNEPSIIHHFADPTSLLYPHFSAGFFISFKLIQRLVKRLPLDDEYSFSIDPKYEFAKLVWDSGNGMSLQHESRLCLVPDNENCATWIEEKFPNCGKPVDSEDVYVAVKTCHRFHLDRIKVLKGTWASEVKNLIIFSDKEEASIPTVKLGVENVAHGHCEKTLSIMKYFIQKNIPLKWLAIVDDDTIMSFHRLRKLLSCYNSSESVAMGERYGYGVVDGLGYDYITGGGGMFFSLSTLKRLVQNCQCPSIDSPDDMIIGMCLKRLGVPVIHSPYFHQARPADYSTEFLKPFIHVSFHKHWMSDPYLVYKNWLTDDLHVEL